MLKLGFLFTFITALTNVLGITKISWIIILAPTLIPIIIGSIISVVMLLLTIVMCLINK